MGWGVLGKEPSPWSAHVSPPHHLQVPAHQHALHLPQDVWSDAVRNSVRSRPGCSCSSPHYLAMVQALGIGPVLIFSTKFVLAFPIVYHFWNGFRHLAWDMGHGFKIAELYKSGYFVVGLSF